MTNNQLKKWAIWALLSVLLVPVVVFIGGSVLVGPYEGEFGIVGMIGTIYGDAARLKGSAWLVLLAPWLLALTWAACFRLSNTMQQRLSPRHKAIKTGGTRRGN